MKKRNIRTVSRKRLKNTFRTLGVGTKFSHINFLKEPKSKHNVLLSGCVDVRTRNI